MVPGGTGIMATEHRCVLFTGAKVAVADSVLLGDMENREVWGILSSVGPLAQVASFTPYSCPASGV
jgi:hypothetical protein